jgi:hypothetical protein
LDEIEDSVESSKKRHYLKSYNSVNSCFKCTFCKKYLDNKKSPKINNIIRVFNKIVLNRLNCNLKWLHDKRGRIKCLNDRDISIEKSRDTSKR